MKKYSDLISLNKNRRGSWVIDTIIGCPFGDKNNGTGCYGVCYSAKFAKIYGFDFVHPVTRYFKDQGHIERTIKKINKIDMPFIRIGSSGDPSYDWGHTIDVCELLGDINKPIVIITKHITPLTPSLLGRIGQLNLCVNTSISTLDSLSTQSYRLERFRELQDYSNSVLRINSCDFNTQNEWGNFFANRQKQLFESGKNIDNILRFQANHLLVKSGVVKISKAKYLKSEVNASVFNKNTYFGPCNECPDMCGINL